MVSGVLRKVFSSEELQRIKKSYKDLESGEARRILMTTLRKFWPLPDDIESFLDAHGINPAKVG